MAMELGEFLGQVELIIHGTTLATNTLINRNGARTGMITTGGFRDIIEIRRGFKNVRTSMYDVFVPPYEPLVPRHLRLEVEERMPVRRRDAHSARRGGGPRRPRTGSATTGVEAVAIGFLHCLRQPAATSSAPARSTREVLPEAYVTSSHEILPVWREYERFSTTRRLRLLRTRSSSATCARSRARLA